MQFGVITVGTSASAVAPTAPLNYGVRLLARAANSGDVYVGSASGVLTTTGNLLPKGAPATSNPFVIPKDHFDGSRLVYIIGSAAGQVVDWSAD